MVSEAVKIAGLIITAIITTIIMLVVVTTDGEKIQELGNIHIPYSHQK